MALPTIEMKASSCGADFTSAKVPVVTMLMGQGHNEAHTMPPAMKPLADLGPDDRVVCDNCLSGGTLIGCPARQQLEQLAARAAGKKG